MTLFALSKQQHQLLQQLQQLHPLQTNMHFDDFLVFAAAAAAVVVSAVVVVRDIVAPTQLGVAGNNFVVVVVVVVVSIAAVAIAAVAIAAVGIAAVAIAAVEIVPVQTVVVVVSFLVLDTAAIRPSVSVVPVLAVVIAAVVAAETVAAAADMVNSQKRGKSLRKESDSVAVVGFLLSYLLPLHPSLPMRLAAMDMAAMMAAMHFLTVDVEKLATALVFQLP